MYIYPQVACFVYMVHPGPSHSMCTMAGRTHSDHRSKGYMVRVENKAVEDAESKGVNTTVANAVWGNFWKENWVKIQEAYQMKERRRWVTATNNNKELEKDSMRCYCNLCI